jgi:hypothetical protein
MTSVFLRDAAAGDFLPESAVVCVTFFAFPQPPPIDAACALGTEIAEHLHVTKPQERDVQSKSCGRCIEWTRSAEALQDVLSNQWSVCEGCTHQRDMKIVVEQYRTRRPRWWTVDGTAVVPIWIVEILRTRKKP